MLAFLKKYFKRLGVKQKYIAEKRDFLNFRMAFLSPNCDCSKTISKVEQYFNVDLFSESAHLWKIR